MHQPRPGSIYNIVDDNPASRAEVMAFAAKLLGPPLDVSVSDKHNADCHQQRLDSPDSADASATATGSDSGVAAVQADSGVTLSNEITKHRSISKRAEKRVSNSKVKTELGLTWEFPSYVEGLSAIHKGDRRPFA